MADLPKSNGHANMSDSGPSTAPVHGSNTTQALAADSSAQPISNAGNAAYPNPLQHRIPSPVSLPTKEALAAVLAKTLKAQGVKNRLAQSSNTFDALANALAAQLHNDFGTEQSPRRLVPAPPANHQDRSGVDSDASWTSGEESEYKVEYFKQLRREIEHICKDSKEPGGHVLTIRLSSRARRHVHLLARQNDCSHTTLADGRILVFADAIVPTYHGNHRRRSSSYSRSAPAVGYYMIPNAATIRNFPADITLEDVRKKFKIFRICTPTSWQPAGNASGGLVNVKLDSAEDAANFVQKLHGESLRPGDVPLHVRFLRRPVSQRPEADLNIFNHLDEAAAVDSMAAMTESSQDSTMCADTIPLEFDLLTPTYDHTADGKLPAFVDSFPSLNSPSSNLDPESFVPRNVPSISWRAPTSHQQTDAGPSTFNPQHLVPPLATQKRPNGDPISDDGSSNGDLSGAEGSASSGGKRKRHPRIKDGYPCGLAACNKTFDSQGECTKHRRIHLPKDQRRFPCDHCDQAFVDGKDLRRHQNAGHKGDAAAARRLSEGERPRATPSPDFNRPDLRASMLQIPDDDHGTFAASSPCTQGMRTPFGGSQSQSPGGFGDVDEDPTWYTNFVDLGT